MALRVLLETDLPVSAAALVNPAVQLAKVVTSGERGFGMTYSWTEESRAAARRLDFVGRASEMAKRDPKPAMLLVTGADDEPDFLEPLE